MKKIFLVWACVSCLVSCRMTGGPESEPMEYELMTVTTRDFEMSTRYAAKIKGRQDVRIIPRVDGYLQEILVKEGQQVRKGQTLFVLESSSYRAQVNNAQAAVLEADAAVGKAGLEYEGQCRLNEKGIVSDFDLRMSEQQLVAAKAGLEAAKAELDAARANLSYTTLCSPSDGVTGSLPYRPGDYVGPSVQDGLTTVSDNSMMSVYFSMSDNQVMEQVARYGSLRQAVDSMPRPGLRLSNGMMYGHEGRIESISGIVDETTGAVTVKAVFPNPDGMLLSGSTASVILPYSVKNAIVIPVQATFEILDKTYVFKVEDGTATSCLIEADAMADGKNLVVTGGLNVGDVIIAAGAGLIQEGTKVKQQKP